MKKSIICTSLLLFTLCAQLLAQNIDLYAVTNGPSIRFGKVDLTSGLMDSTSMISQTQSQNVVLFSSAFDQSNRSYLFLSKESTSGLFHFHNVNVVTNSQLPTSTLNENERVHGLRYDLRSKKLYGLQFDSLTSTVFLAEVNLQTGKIITKNPISGVTDFCVSTFYCGTATTFDPQRGIYMFIGKQASFTSRLYRVKASTGQVLSNTPLSSSIFGIQYDIKGDALYGIGFEDRKVALFEMDTTLGIKRHVKSLNAMESGYLNGSSCFDQESQTYIVLQKANTQGLARLTCYNIPGDSLYEVVTNNTLRELEVDNSAFGTAYFGSSQITDESLSMENISIFPNPAIHELRIESTQIQKRINMISLYDIAGKEVLRRENINSTAYSLNVTGLPTGMYQLKLQIGHQTGYRRISIKP